MTFPKNAIWVGANGGLHYSTASLSPLAKLIRWLRGGPYADVVFA